MGGAGVGWAGGLADPQFGIRNNGRILPAGKAELSWGIGSLKIKLELERCAITGPVLPVLPSGGCKAAPLAVAPRRLVCNSVCNSVCIRLLC